MPSSYSAWLSDNEYDKYMGRTLLSVDRYAIPAFFRPPSSPQEIVVRSGSIGGLSMDTICRALSLETNIYVNAGPFWEHYDELIVYLPAGISSSFFYGTDRTGPLRSTGLPTTTLSNQHFHTRLESL